MIIIVIWKENINLWISKIPKQVYSYTFKVNLSIIARSLVYKTGSFLASLRELWKTIKYEFKEYSYIWLICDNPHIAKNNIAPRRATGVYDWRACSIYSDVISPFSISSEISIDTFFVAYNVAIKT